MWIEPPATTSAPEATEPITVTSPFWKATDWTVEQQRGCLRLGRPLFDGCTARRRIEHLDATGRAAALEQRRQPGAEPGRIRSLDSHEADAACLELRHQPREIVLGQLHSR